jgi:CHAT domain-containing protein
VQDYALVMYNAAAGTNLTRAPRADWKVAALGVSQSSSVQGTQFPALPAVPQELSAIVDDAAAGTGGVLPGVQYLDKGFSVDALVEAIRQRYPVLHLASHFHFSAINEDGSFLLLGNNQVLSLQEFRSGNNFELAGVELLTLSACQTAMGAANASGQEIDGLGALAQYRGAQSVLATLWSVADTSTGLFMERFYADRERDQLTKAQALRQVQLGFIEGTSRGSSAPQQTRNAVRQDRAAPAAPAWQQRPGAPFSHPYFWAPFVLMGNWL